MSLLLDALKRAEQAKQSAQTAQESKTADAELIGGGEMMVQQSGIGTLALEEIVEPPRQTQAQAAANSDRDAVRNVFAAKQSSLADSRATKPVWLLPVIAVVVIAVGGGGWFVWNEINKLSPGTRIAAAPVPKPVTSAAPAAPAPAPMTPTQPGPNLEPTAPQSGVAASTEDKLAKVPMPEKVAGGRSAVSAGDRAREELARSLRASDRSAEAPVTLKLARGIEPPKVSEALAEAYTALRLGKYAEAKKQYELLVRNDGMNLDARLGLATSLARSGEPAAALREYKKALEIDPRNSTALAALLILTDIGSASALEADLRALLTRYGDSAPLHYALGNLLASQSRWTEAQQAYFDAWRHGGDNSDYAFNLAVSLDQLRQGRLAAEYYQKALSLAARQGGQFDRRQAERRVNELKSAQASQ